MRFKSIRTKLVFFISLLSLLAILIMQTSNILLMESAFSKQINESMQSSLDDAHRQIYSSIQTNFSALEAVASMPLIQDAAVSLEDKAASLGDFIKTNEKNGYLACAVTDTQGRAVLSFGTEIDVTPDAYFHEAMQGKNVVSDPFISRATGNLLIVYAVPYYDLSGNIAGVITLDVNALHLSSGFKAQGLGKSGSAFVITADGTAAVSTDESQVANQENHLTSSAKDASFAKSLQNMLLGNPGDGEHVRDGVREIIYYMPVEGTGWMVAVTQSKGEAYSTLDTVKWNGIGVMVIVVIISIIAGTFLARSIARPLGHLVHSAKQLAKGDINVTIQADTQDEISVLAHALEDMCHGIRQQADTIDSIAQGDYTVSIPVRSDDDRMNISINRMVDNNNTMVKDIRQAADQVAAGASQIAIGSQMLAAGSTQEAETIQQFSTSVSQVHDQAEANTQLAQSTRQKMGTASQLVNESINSMEKMGQSMNAIEVSSQQIAKVMRVIDDIAFQTNILALNASVEAARAGQHGKGFAVVADEVRSLAAKSAEAAQETAALITNSVENVSQGVKIAELTGKSLAQVGTITKDISGAMEQISESSIHQREAIEQINDGINQITYSVQANSAAAEESAASAQELDAQSVLMNQTMRHFKLRGDESTLPEGEQKTTNYLN